MVHQMVLFTDRFMGSVLNNHALSVTHCAIMGVWELSCERKKFRMSESFHVAIMQDDELSLNWLDSQYFKPHLGLSTGPAGTEEGPRTSMCLPGGSAHRYSFALQQL